MVAWRSATGKPFKAAETAVSAALEAQKDAVSSAFAASREAINKSESSQLQYNQSHNDLLRKMDEQAKYQMPRPEIESRLKGFEDNIEHLRVRVTELEKTSTGFGVARTSEERHTDLTLVYVGIGISLLLGLMGWVIPLVLHFWGKG